MAEFRCLDFLVCQQGSAVASQSFIRPEEEQFVVYDWAANAAGKIAIFLVHALRAPRCCDLELRRRAGFASNGAKRSDIIGPVKLVERIQAFVVELAECGTVKSIRSILRDHFYLGAAVAPIFSGIRVADDAQLLNRFGIRRQHGCSTLAETIYTHAVQLVIVRRNALAIGDDLDLIFNLENLAI